MNRPVVASLVGACLLAPLAACSAASSETTGSSDESLIVPVQCHLDNCSNSLPIPPPATSPPAPPAKNIVAAVDAGPAQPPLTTLPPNTTVDSSGDFTSTLGCDPGYTSCEFEPLTDEPALTDPTTGALLPCTQVYFFLEYNAAAEAQPPPDGGTWYEYTNYIAYCEYSTAAEQQAVNDWVRANAASVPHTAPVGTPMDAVASYQQDALSPPAAGYIYLQYMGNPGLNKHKCKGNGDACQPAPGYGTF